MDQLDAHLATLVQIGFSRLNLQYTVLSKRRLIQLVEEGHVSGWDDPRMPTISGLRRREYTSESLQLFAERIGISKAENNIYMSVLEDCIPGRLGPQGPTSDGSLASAEGGSTNWPEDQVEELDAPVHQQFPERDRRPIPLSREIFIDEDDFEEDPPEGFHRLVPGGEVRLRNAYVIRCEEVIKDASGKVIELRCIYDPNTARGKNLRGARSRGSFTGSLPPMPSKPKYDFMIASSLNPHREVINPIRTSCSISNPNSMEVLSQAWLEPNLTTAEVGTALSIRTQLGYFCLDSRDSKANSLVFNRIVTLRDSWGGKVS